MVAIAVQKMDSFQAASKNFKTFGILEPELLELLHLNLQYVCGVGIKLGIEQRARVNFYSKLGKRLIETFSMTQQIFGDKDLSCRRAYERYICNRVLKTVVKPFITKFMSARPNSW